MTDPLELNKRYARLVKDLGVDAISEALDWAEWDEQDWIDSIESEILDGTHDAAMVRFLLAIEQRQNDLGITSNTNVLKAVDASSDVPRDKYDIALGEQYVIRTGRRDRWEGVVVKAINFSRQKIRCLVITTGTYPVKRGGTPIEPGMTVNVTPQVMRKLKEPHADSLTYTCVGWIDADQSPRLCPAKNKVPSPNARCQVCVDRGVQAQADKMKREADARAAELKAEAERERRAAAAKKAAEKKAEESKPKPGARRVMRRGF